MFDNFYRGKRILVTGVAGVKGSWLALMLLEAGAEVSGIDLRNPDRRSNFRASGLLSEISFIQGDVCNLRLMRQLVGEADGVFHLAAKALVHEARQKPFEAYRTNTLGAAAVLESMRLSAGPKYGVFVTTDKVYRPKNGQHWVESDPLVATGAYAVSKACAEFIIRDYQQNHLSASRSRVAVARAGNVVIGGDLYSSRTTDGAGRIVVDCFEALAEDRAPQIFAPTFTRPYTYGLDVLSGYMTLMSRLDREDVAGEPFNFGPQEQSGVSNAALATRICELWGTGIMWERSSPREEPFEYQSLSADKSRDRLNWRPAFTLEQALLSTTRWYKKWAELGNTPGEGSLRNFNRDLIAEHRVVARDLGIGWALPDGARLVSGTPLNASA